MRIESFKRVEWVFLRTILLSLLVLSGCTARKVSRLAGTANEAFEKGQYAVAREHLREAEALAPDHADQPEWVYLQGLTEQKLSLDQAAYQSYSRFLSSDNCALPTHPNAGYLASKYVAEWDFDAGKYSAALAVSDRALRQFPYVSSDIALVKELRKDQVIFSAMCLEKMGNLPAAGAEIFQLTVDYFHSHGYTEPVLVLQSLRRKGLDTRQFREDLDEALANAHAQPGRLEFVLYDRKIVLTSANPGEVTVAGVLSSPFYSYLVGLDE